MFYYLGKLVYSILANIIGLGSERDFILESHNWFFMLRLALWVSLVYYILHREYLQLKNDPLGVWIIYG